MEVSTAQFQRMIDGGEQGPFAGPDFDQPGPGGMERLDPDGDFFSLGVDSRNRLTRRQASMGVSPEGVRMRVPAGKHPPPPLLCTAIWPAKNVWGVSVLEIETWTRPGIFLMEMIRCGERLLPSQAKIVSPALSESSVLNLPSPT